MTEAELKRGNLLDHLIKETERSISHYEKVLESEEIMLVVNTPEIQEAIKGMYFNGKSPAPHYFSGEIKNKMISIVLERDVKRRDKYIKELEIL